MHFLYFLSSSPKMFIFEKEAAKTNFGGVLFLIYILVMFFISLAYIVDYAINDKYTYEIKTIDNTTINEQEIKQEESGFLYLNEDDKLNPIINFSLQIQDKGYAVYVEELGYINGDLLSNDSDRTFFNFTKSDESLIEINFKCGNDSNCTNSREAFDQRFILFYTS